MLQSEVASNRGEGSYSGLVTMALGVLGDSLGDSLSLSLSLLNSSYSESPKVITSSGGSTLSTGETLMISELDLHAFARFDGLLLAFRFSPELLCLGTLT